MIGLAGRHVVVTGAAGFLGARLAAVLKDAGARVTGLDLDQSRLDERLPRGPECRGFAVDLLDADATLAVAGTVISEVGAVDALVNVAGGFAMGDPVHETSLETYAQMFDLNARTLIHSVRAFTPSVVEQRGAIVNIGARGALRGGANMGAYAASKSVVHRLTESMSEELRQRGVNVNAVLPSILDTPANREAMPDADPGAWVAPESLAGVIVFLLSDAARDVHGALIPVAALS